MKQEKSCGAIIYNKDKKVLVVKHNAGHWDFPKGHVEAGETEIETATREVKEETNVDINIIEKCRYSIEYSPKEGVWKEVIFFLAMNTSDNVVKQDAEIANIGWFSYDEAMELLTYDIAKKLLKDSYTDLNNLDM